MTIGRKTGGGSRANSPNKLTKAVKESLEETFTRLGSVDRMVTWAEDNLTDFYKLWAKLLPKDINLSASIDLQLCDALKELADK